MRIGLEYVHSLGEEEAETLVAERQRAGSYAGIRELAQRSGLDARAWRRSSPRALATCSGLRRRVLLW